MLSRSWTTVLKVVQQLLLCKELVLVNEHLPCGDARFTRVQRVDSLQVAVQCVNGSEVLGVCRTAVSVAVVAAVVGVWLLLADGTVDGA